MWRVLVVSDSHGRNENVKRAIEKAGKFDIMIHLGDVGTAYREVERMAGVPTYIVAGNNDFSRELLDRNIIEIGGHRIFATHGHRQSVHFGVERLYYLALENGCDIVMYGHTHVPYLEEADDVTILNPGSLTYPRQEGHEKTFVVMTIEDDDSVSYVFDHI